MASSFLKKQANKRAKRIQKAFGEGVYGSTPYIDRVTEYEQDRRDAEEEWRQRQNAQLQAERNAEIAEWIKGTSSLELEDKRQKQRLDYRPQYEAQQNRNISEYIKSLSPLEIEKEEQQRRIEEKEKKAQRPGANAHTPEMEAEFLYANGVRPKKEEEGPNKLTPLAEFMYQHASKRREPEPEAYKPEPPSQKLTPDVEAEYVRRSRGEEPGHALTPYQQYMATYNAQQEQNAKNVAQNAESAWPGVGKTAGGMAANFISGMGQPIVNLARGIEGFEDMLYRVTGNETFNLDRRPGLRNSEALKESDQFATLSKELREKVGPLGQQLIDAAGAAGNMLSSFAFFGMGASAAGNPVNATARMANMGGGKIGSALGRLGARAGIEILSNPGNFGISLGSAIGSYSEAYAKGAGFGQAMTNGLLKGMTEYYSNKLFSGTPFEDSADKGYVTKLIERAASDLGGSDILKFINDTTGGKVINWAFDKAGEGLEEVVTGVLDPMIDRITYDRTKDLATVDELTEEFIGGVLLSFLMEGGEAVVSGLQSQTKMTEREAEARLVKRGVDPKTAKKYAKDIAEAVTSMLEDRQNRSSEYDKKSIGDPETAAKGASSDSKALQEYATVYNRESSAKDLRRGANPAEVDQGAFLTENEAKNFFYIWNNQGAEAADAYYDLYLAPALEQRRNAAMQQFIQKTVREWQAEDALMRAEARQREEEAERRQTQAEETLAAQEAPTRPPVPQNRAVNAELQQGTEQNSQLPAQDQQENAQERPAPPLPSSMQKNTETGTAAEPAQSGPPLPSRMTQEQGARAETPAAQERAQDASEAAQETAQEAPKQSGSKAQQTVATQRKRAMADSTAVSLQSRGFTEAGAQETAFIREEAQMDAEERAVTEALRAEGLELTLFTGLVTDAEGKKVSILQDGNRVALQADNRSRSLTSLAEQVLGHPIASQQTSDLSTASGPHPLSGEARTENAAEMASSGEARSAAPAGNQSAVPAATGAQTTPTQTASAAPRSQTAGLRTRENPKAQAARESALQAGASEETANQVARLAKILNKDIRCVNEPERNGAVKNGWTQDGVIYYNVAGNERPLAWVVGHELTHNTEHVKTYEKLAALTKRVYGKQWDTEVRQLMGERAEVAKRLGDSNVEIDRNETEREIVANFFADNLLTNEDMIREVVENDAPTARRILNYLKDLLRKWQGKEPTIERAIDLYSKALKEVAAGAQEKGAARGGLTAGNPARSAQDIKNRKYSVQSIFNAAGFQVTMKGGRVIATDGNGQRITEMTEDMVRRSGIGTMIRYAQEVTKSISKAEAQTQVEGLTRLFNLMLKAQDGDMVWRFAGSAMFSAVKSNSDGQYSTTVDFSTVCKKTEEMMRTMSTVMMRTHKGLTKDQIIELQNDILAENGLVPCPVCYVFSRWAGVGGILDNMAKFQKKYDGAEWDDPARMKARIDQLKAATKTKKALQALLMEEDNAYQQFTGELEANQAEQKTLRAEKKSLTGKNADAAANAARVAEIDKRLKELDGLNALLKADIQAIEKSGAPEAAWLERVRSKPNYREEGYVEEDLLYNLLAADKLAEEKPLAWGYRTSRGPSAGKAILPYSDMRVGDWVLGPKANSAKGANPLFSSVGEQFSKDQTKAIDAAKMKVLAQNLIGGQRYQSTSDFMYDYGLDYLLSFFEGQMLGSKMQTYTKVMEFVNLVASVHGDVNISMMPLDAGYVTEADGRQHLIYSSVTGANPEAAIKANHLFDNAQLILVGINDQHILLALEDSEETGGAEIGFVIPYHASGASINNFIRGLVENLKETFDEKNYKNYEPMQNDSHRKNATATQEARERLRRYLLTGKRGKSELMVMTGNPDGLTDTEMNLLKGRSKDISDRSFEELREIEKRALAGDKAAIKEYESWSAGFLGDLYKKMWTNEKAKDTYGVRLTGDQPDHIMPHEFWDTRVDREHAYINGFRFRSYCYSLGLTPRFTGVNSAGKHLGYGDFSDSKGYWKTLIDRPMYDRSGKYRDQQTMNVTELSGSISEENAGMLSPEYGREFWGENAQTPDTGVAARAAERYLERNEGKAQADGAPLEGKTQYSAQLKKNNDYLSAVESGNMETAQRMVDEAAERAMPDSKVRDNQGRLMHMYHGTSSYGFTVFDYGKRKFGLFGTGFYFTDSRNVAEGYKEKGKGTTPGMYDVYLNITNPIDMDAPADLAAWEKAFRDSDYDLSYLEGVESNEDAFKALKEFCQDAGMYKYEAEEAIEETLRGMGYDGITHVGGGRYGAQDAEKHRVYIALNQEQIKSAEPVTYEDGAPIPLSERFNQDEPDIRYSAQLKDKDKTPSFEYMKPFAEQLKDFMDKEKRAETFGRDALLIGTTPQIFQDIGLTSLPVAINQTHVKYVTDKDYSGKEQYKEGHTFTIDEFAKLPEKLADPVAIIADQSKQDLVVYVEMTNESGSQTIVPFRVDTKTRLGGRSADVQLAKSVYGGDDSDSVLAAAIGKDSEDNVRVYYVNKSKIPPKISAAVREYGRTVPDGIIHTINDPGAPVKGQKKSKLETSQFKNWFKGSKVVDSEGNPKIVYHQTASNFWTFNTNNPVAAKYDSGTPNGIFFKDNDHDIGIGGDRQMAVYLAMRNPLQFANREAANKWYQKHIDGYADLQNQMKEALRPYDTELNAIENEMFADGVTDEQYEELNKKWDAKLEEMRKVEDKYRGQLRELLNDYFLKNDSGFDGIILDYDGHRYVDGKRENVKTYIVFKNTQVKSATDNIGLYDPRNPDIRYSAELTDKERSAEALEGRLLGSRELLGTPALKKLGVKVSGSVGRYANTEQLMAKNKAAKQLKKAAADAEKRLQATEAEKDFASGIAAMVYDEEDIPVRLRRDVVMELADYYFASDSANLDTLAKIRADINAGLRAEAGDLLEEADFKPQSMLKLNERTPERNFRAMFGERGDEITEWLVQPVRENEAEKIRWFNAQLDKVREFEDSKGKKRELTRQESALTMKYMEGTAAAQMIADLETDPKNRYGKQTAKNIKNAATNIRNGESAADAAKEFSLGDREKDLAAKYAAWQNTLQELKESDSTIVENAAKAYAELFDQYYEAINDFLVAHGYEPIGYIKGYAPHMQPEATQTMLEKALGALGVNAEVKELPASIAGQTAIYKPNKRWNPYFLQRTGSTAEYDIVKAFESYVDYMADIFYHTDDIMRARQMVRWIRQSFAPEEIRSKLDYIDTIRQAPTEVKTNLLRDAGEIGKTTVMSPMDTEAAMQEYVDKLFEQAKNTSKYSNLVMWLENYANILAGKQSFADRGWEYSTGRKSLNTFNRLNNAFQKSNVAGNLSSVINQTAQLPMIAAELGERDFLGGLVDVVTGKAKNWAQDSDFLTEKEGKDYLYADNADKFIDALYKPASWMDHLVSTVAVRGAFDKAIRQGKSYEQAMRYADDFGRKLMGSRAKGSRPLAYESKGAFSKMVHMFQVECANSWDHIASDLPYEIKQIAKTQGKGKAARTLAALIIRALLGTFLLNRTAEELYGGTPAPFDILGLAANFVASGQGLTTNRWMKKIIDNGMEKLGGERIFGTKATEGSDEFSVTKAGEELLYNVMNDLPLARNVAGVFGLGDQTVPLPGASGEFKDVGTAISKLLKDGVDEGELADLLRATLKAASQFAPGGRQIRKTAEGAEAVIRGGSYKNGKLQYPVNGAADTARALAFGKNATQAARDFWAAGGKALSEKQTGIYQGLVDEGMSQQEAYDTITGYRDEGNLNDYVKWTDSRSRDAGIDEGTYLQFREDTKGITGDPDGKGGTVSGSKKAKIVGYIDGLEDLTPEQKTAMLLDYNSTYSLKDLPWIEGASAEPQETKPAAEPGSPVATEPNKPAPTEPEKVTKMRGTLTELGLQDSKVDALAPVLGGDGSNTAKWRAVANQNLGKSQQDAVLRAIMTDSMYRNWTIASGENISLDDYVTGREAYVDLDNSGTDQNGEWTAALEQVTFDKDTARDNYIKGILWQIYTGSTSTKNNPFDKAAGQKVLDAKNSGGKTGGDKARIQLPTQRQPWEMPTRSKLTRPGLQTREAPRAAKPRGGLVATGRPYTAGTGGLVLKKK